MSEQSSTCEKEVDKPNTENNNCDSVIQNSSTLPSVTSNSVSDTQPSSAATLQIEPLSLEIQQEGDKPQLESLKTAHDGVMNAGVSTAAATGAQETTTTTTMATNDITCVASASGDPVSSVKELQLSPEQHASHAPHSQLAQSGRTDLQPPAPEQDLNRSQSPTKPECIDSNSSATPSRLHTAHSDKTKPTNSS